MAKKRWTDEAIRALRPDDGKAMQWFAVGDGLVVYLRRAKAGELSRQWHVRVQVHGKRLSQRIGEYPQMSLAQARRRVAEVMGEAERARINAETHPIVARRVEVQRKLDEPTVAEFFEQFIAATAQGRRNRRGRPASDRTVELLRASFETDVLPVMGGLKLRHVTRADCERCLQRPVDRNTKRMSEGGRAAPAGGRGAAAGVYKVLGALFNYADDQEAIDANPMVRVKNPRPYQAPDVVRVLSDAELRDFLTAMRTSPRISPAVRLMLELELFTGCRPSEARLARWDQVDERARRWHLADADKKERRAFVVTLSDEALAVLREARALRRPGGVLIFPSPIDDPSAVERPIEKNAGNHAIARMCAVAGIGHKSAHDLRRTLRTIMARLGVDDSVAQRCIAHKHGGPLAATYNGHKYELEMAAAWAKVGAHITALMAGGAEVVPIRAAAGA